jgi:hypothetical protein
VGVILPPETRQSGPGQIVQRRSSWHVPSASSLSVVQPVDTHTQTQPHPPHPARRVLVLVSRLERSACQIPQQGSCECFCRSDVQGWIRGAGERVGWSTDPSRAWVTYECVLSRQRVGVEMAEGVAGGEVRTMVGRVSACVLTSMWENRNHQTWPTNSKTEDIIRNEHHSSSVRKGCRFCEALCLSLLHVQRGSHHRQAVSCCGDEFELTCSCHINLW